MTFRLPSYQQANILLFVFTVVFFSCKKDELKREAKVDTKAVSEILSTSAKVTGDIIDLGIGITDHGHCWGPSAEPTVTGLKTTLGSSTIEGIYTSSLINLEPRKLYHVRAYVKSGDKVLYGADIQFTTLGPPTVSTTVATTITTSGATIGGNITIDGGASITDRGVYWRESTNPDTTGTKLQIGTGTGIFSTILSGLTPNTIYYFKAFATNIVGAKYGSWLSFTTAVALPTITTTAITDLTSTTAKGGGNITSDGGGTITSRGVCWGSSVNPTTTLTTKTTDGAGSGIFTSSITGLLPGTTYHVRAYATNSAGTSYGNDITITSSSVPPTVTTTAITAITSSTATAGGNVTSNGGTLITARGVCWGTTAEPTIALITKSSETIGTGIFISSITGLSPGITYHVRAYATNSSGTSYGNDITFNTSANLPALTTVTVTDITTTTATSGGNITSDGGGAAIARGICWSTSANPTIASTTKTSDGTGTGTFTSSLTGLIPGTVYHVRAYATNSSGTGYGADITFTTVSAAPIVTTTVITTITSNTATAGGGITSDGGSAVTAKGICWSTAADPTIALTTKTSNGTGTGNFTSNITGLVPTTVYHVRAYATNSIGTGYGNDITFTTSIGLPVITTSSISGISPTTAMSGGNITSDGGGAVTARGICWSTTANPTTALTTKTSDGTGTGTFISNITGLTPVTLYHVRAYATNSSGTAYGTDVSFTTAAYPPTLTTTAITSITANTASSGGSITADGGASITARGVCWSTTPTPTISNTKTIDGTGSGIFTSNLTLLESAKTYYVRSYATNSGGTGYGDELSFTTSIAPTVTTTDITGITSTTSATGGNVIASGGSPVTARGVCWSTTATPTVANSKTTDGSGTGSYTSSITGLTPGTTYYVRAYATNTSGTGYGAEKSFVTLIVPTVTTADISNITATSATSGGDVTFDGNTTVTARGICWSITQNPTISNSKTVDGTGTGPFTGNMTTLNPNTIYYVRAYATNSVGTAYGDQKSFTTGITLPTITTTAITSITTTTATSGGNITSDGGSAITARGVCWSISHNPTLSDSQTYNGTGTGSFVSNLTGLTAGTTYYVRAYATNNSGTAYGSELSFSAIIPPGEPTGVTASAGNAQVTVTFTAPVSDGGSTITGYTITSSPGGLTANGTASPIIVTGLTNGTAYTFTVTATNAIGTSSASSASNTVTPTASVTTVTDIDGNVYGTVTIGTQVWMVGNLKTTKYNDGTAIPNVTDNTAWGALITPAYCWYNNDAASYKATYGALYNWYTADVASNGGKNVCPTGWHVPTDAEWTSLTTYLGGESVAGGKLKETGTTHWLTPNTGATNETGFTALPGGYRSFNGAYYYIGSGGYWWSSTEYSTTYAWFRYMSYDYTNVYRYYFFYKPYGFSVRCVRDF